jgi:RNA polymerase sigma-70 factor (ECF subfamily)
MEQEAVKRLFMQHYVKMQRVARTLLYDEKESEDVCSDVFETLLRGDTLLVPGTEEHYLMTSVRNRCLKRLRHEKLTKALPQRGSGEGADIEDDRLDDIEEFVVSHLSERDQRIFNLRFSEGYSYEEIAVAEGISKVAVWKHLSHAITEIKKHFNPKNV